MPWGKAGERGGRKEGGASSMKAPQVATFSRLSHGHSGSGGSGDYSFTMVVVAPRVGGSI